MLQFIGSIEDLNLRTITTIFLLLLYRSYFRDVPSSIQIIVLFSSYFNFDSNYHLAVHMLFLQAPFFSFFDIFYVLYYIIFYIMKRSYIIFLYLLSFI